MSSKLGPSIRQPHRGLRPEREPSGQGPGPTGQEIPRPWSNSSTLRQGASPGRTRPRQIQIPGTLLFYSVWTRVNYQILRSERAFNQQPSSGSLGQPGAAVASKLPVKGLTPTRSSSVPEDNEKSRGAAEVSPASTSAPSDAAINSTCAVPKLHVTGSRTPTLQARTSAPSEYVCSLLRLERTWNIGDWKMSKLFPSSSSWDAAWTGFVSVQLWKGPRLQPTAPQAKALLLLRHSGRSPSLPCTEAARPGSAGAAQVRLLLPNPGVFTRPHTRLDGSPEI